MNFSFDESGEMGSKTHSENFNLFYFLERCSNTIHCNILLRVFLLKNNVYSTFECKAEFLCICTSHIEVSEWIFIFVGVLVVFLFPFLL